MKLEDLKNGDIVITENFQTQHPKIVLENQDKLREWDRYCVCPTIINKSDGIGHPWTPCLEHHSIFCIEFCKVIGNIYGDSSELEKYEALRKLSGKKYEFEYSL